MKRRFFLNRLAALGAGLTTSTITAKAANAETSLPERATPSALGTRPRAVGSVVASTAATVVETTAGKIRGSRRDGIYCFKGVPYGASTSGAARFMPPARPEPWSGIRNALHYGRVCPMRSAAQANTDGRNLAPNDEDAFLLHRGYAEQVPGEDCLRVNVWTPEINGSGRRPVMVYLHGGGFSVGCGHDLLSYDGENLARNHDVVVVNHTHRLNVYGYLNLAEIGGEKFASSANAGVLDLVAALEWVRDNIARFGGDPNNVMIFGQSGGGGKVLALMATPAAKGLFHRAAVQSGPDLRLRTPDYTARLAAGVMQELGLSKSQVGELQAISVDRLSGAAAEALRKLTPPGGSRLRRAAYTTGWGPTLDGRILPHHPFDPAAAALSAHVPFLTGSNLHEGVSGVDRPDAEAMTLDDLHERARVTLGERARAIVDAYRREYPGASPFGIFATLSASAFRRPSVEQATAKAALGGAPAYAYLYSWHTPMLDGRPGPFHSAEISFVFDNAELCDQYSGRTPDALALAKHMSTAWVNFARSGNPHHAGLPPWSAYATDERATMVFDNRCAIRHAPESEPLRLLAEV